ARVRECPLDARELGGELRVAPREARIDALARRAGLLGDTALCIDGGGGELARATLDGAVVRGVRRRGEGEHQGRKAKGVTHRGSTTRVGLPSVHGPVPRVARGNDRCRRAPDPPRDQYVARDGVGIVSRPGAGDSLPWVIRRSTDSGPGPLVASQTRSARYANSVKWTRLEMPSTLSQSAVRIATHMMTISGTAA